MKKLVFIVLVFLYGCSPKIHEHFEQTQYVKDFNIHIVNDSLQLYLKSPVDIRYTTNRKALKKIIRKEKFEIMDSVLVHGKADDPPYEYFVTLSQNHKQNFPENLIVFDTLIDNQTIQFIGNPFAENSRELIKLDLNNIFKSLEIGPNYRKEVSTIFDIINRHQNSNKFYAVLTELSEYPAYSDQDKWMKLQMELTYSSFLGDNKQYDKYLKHLEAGFEPNDSISKIIKEYAETDSQVIKIIIKEAKQHKIVMINENHYYPHHRLLISDLLIELKQAGYTYLALEALDIEAERGLNAENAYPTLKTGFYTVEQNYANLIRQAKDLGYEFVAYENTDTDKERELGQAENLYNKTFGLNPESKVLVLAGIDHIMEKTPAGERKRMATIFKEKYDMDPLTISQTHLNSYRKEIPADYSIISSEYFENDRLRSIDYLVLNNKTLPDTFPTFTYQNKENTDVQLALFYGNEIIDKYDHDNKVPYFSTLLEKGKKIDLPIRKNGDSYLYLFDKYGKELDKQLITPSDLEH